MRQLIIILTLLLGINGTAFMVCKKLDLSFEKFGTDITRIITARQRTGDLWRELGINKQSKEKEQTIIKEINGLLGKLPSENKEKTITETKKRTKKNISKNWFRFKELKHWRRVK